MPSLLVPFLAVCVLLAGAGVGKLRRPAGTAQALRTQGLPSSLHLVRALGAAEVVLAAAAAAQLPGTAALLAVAYAGFTGFVLLAVLRGRPLSSCGCFGEPDLPPNRVHAVVTAAAAACGVAVAVGPGAGLPALGALGPGTAVAAAGGVALTTWLAYLVLTGLPRLAVAAALVSPAPGPRSASS